MSEDVKQVIVVRKDLKCRRGKMMAQVAHASLKVILDMMCKQGICTSKGEVLYEWNLRLEKGNPIEMWLNGLFTKIVVSVNSEAEIMDLARKAHTANLPYAVITDAGKTEFKEPTVTCIAIGPDKSERIDDLTRELPLL